MDLPLTEQKEILSKAITFNEIIKYSDDFDEGKQLFELIKNCRCRIRCTIYQTTISRYPTAFCKKLFDHAACCLGHV